MFKKQKAFTLVELLIVISIIGILAGLILVSMTLARKRSVDARIMETAKSLMSAIQIEAVSNNTFSDYYTGWLANPGDCDSHFGATPDPAKFRDGCKRLLADMEGAPGLKLFIHSAGGQYPKLTILALLPGSRKYFCAGSNGKSSQTPNDDTSIGAGCPGVGWTCPGCYYDSSTPGL